MNDNWPVRKAEQIWKQLRAHKIAEIEALEACKWLRAAGFPQYAQLYEDQQFPVDISAVEQDHPMLEASVMKSLFRRLQALNRCANVHQQKQTEADEEEETCALSENWTYQSDVRRWSRVDQLEMPTNIDEWHKNVLKKQQSKHLSIRDKLGIFGSSRHRRGRDGASEGSPVLDFLSRQISGMSTNDAATSGDKVAPLEADCADYNSRYRNRKTRSFDRTDRWTSSPSHNANQDRITWRALSTSEEWDDEKFDLEEGGRPIFTLACTQLHVLRKLALLKLTAHMEKYCPTHRTGWNWDLPKLMRKIKSHAYREKSVFGVPLTVILQKTGSALPKGIEEALIWLQQSAYDQVGLFRKSGVKSRIANLKQLIETQAGDCLNFSEYQAHDIADVIKQYFRELPEALLTNKLSETFMLIFQFVPEEERRQAVLCALLLMPDEHCEILLVLLRCLTSIAENSVVNQMNESNLAVCFAPSLFYYSNANTAARLPASSASNTTNTNAHEKELAEHKAAHDCLLYFLQNCNNLFKIPREFLQQCASSEMKETSVMKLSELGLDNGGWKGYMQDCQNVMMRESREKDWIYIQTYNPKIEISYKKISDGYPLRMWRLCCEIDAPPGEVLYRILKERPKWDKELHSTRTLSQIDKNVELFQYARRNVGPLPMEEYCVVRAWRTDLPGGTCLIIETSVEDPEAVNIPNSVRGIVLASRYLIEVYGGNKSRLTHFSRIDTRGRMPEWYHNNYAHICAINITNLQKSFKSNGASTAGQN